MNGDGNASPMADDEQPHPEPMLAEAAESSFMAFSGDIDQEFKMNCNDSDDGNNASPVADEQPCPDPVMPEAAAQGSSSTDPSTLNGDDMLDYYRYLRHMHFHRFSAPMRRNAFAHVMEEIAPDNILMMLFVGGELVANGAYTNGGFGGAPASEEAMAVLPETTVGQDDIMRKNECAVCLEAYDAGDTVRTMPCSHGFHESCIFQWLPVSRLCPLCQRRRKHSRSSTPSTMTAASSGGSGSAISARSAASRCPQLNQERDLNQEQDQTTG